MTHRTAPCVLARRMTVVGTAVLEVLGLVNFLPDLLRVLDVGVYGHDQGD